jgi:hypothetical protein
MFELPRCRHCARKWVPAEGVSARDSFCSACSEDRREIAKMKLRLKPIRRGDIVGGHCLPRSHRAKKSATR